MDLTDTLLAFVGNFIGNCFVETFAEFNALFSNTH
jgi:hypothetical protein